MIVEAVKAENAKNKTLDKIKALDADRMANKGITPFMQELLDNDCSNYLKEIGSMPFYDEIVVMDNQGALVGLTALKKIEER